MQAVSPQTFLIASPQLNRPGLANYLRHTNQTAFMEDVEIADVGDPLIISSLMAKLCYKSLVTGKNANLTKTRPIRDNVAAAFDHGHGSVFEHGQFSFITTGCSRVFTHELVRHRVGTAFSQTSGRYVLLENEFEMVLDPILEDVRDVVDIAMMQSEDLYKTLRLMKGVYTPEELAWAKEHWKKENFDRIPGPVYSFEEKKLITSALRRLIPNGIANEIGWSANIRALRHMVMMRTSRHAEREIREVFSQVYGLIMRVYPMIFYGADENKFDDLWEITDMKMQPYERD